MSRTFSIGGIHPHDHKISVNASIEDFPLMDMAYISVSQHLGAPAEPVVAKGDTVKVGQLIAKASGFISANIHSSVSGTVTAVEPMPDISGNLIPHIVIKVEGDVWDESIDRSPKIVKEIKASSKEIIDIIAKSGIVGLGGAAFPTHIKLSPPPGKKAEYLLINGAECEPYLTSDYRVMLEYPEQMLIGTKIMMMALGVEKAYIGIEENKPKALKLLKKIASKSYKEIKVVSLKKRYPQGGEKQLIDAIIHRQVPSMGLPIDVGVVVQNVGTALAVYEAVQKNKPLFDGIVTVTGGCMTEQRNFRLRVGTNFERIMYAIGGFPKDAVKLISGGPMMGKAISRMDAATVKSTSALLLLTDEETRRGEEGNCIRCAKCVEACPMGLEPYLLNRLARAGRIDDLETNLIQDCIECGCCFYSCPSNIPLLDTIRLAKGQVLRIIRSRPKK
ncbi:MAG: electron transporter RnfC [Bacteroidetes bacterium GWE2_39_28]|nr:MAG: electron transporter RnfC [Bacteroidetes bacterium GWE2_39_28]OFZ10680.1 MAG: electron transporter RnfC [Bacteroidetes bacterium RIFOXYC2_FULL_39_11]HCT93405.1 electron transport complex subunit RsxC [Rikenellaceae bacterium]